MKALLSDTKIFDRVLWLRDEGVIRSARHLPMGTEATIFHDMPMQILFEDIYPAAGTLHVCGTGPEGRIVAITWERFRQYCGGRFVTESNQCRIYGTTSLEQWCFGIS